MHFEVEMEKNIGSKIGKCEEETLKKQHKIGMEVGTEGKKRLKRK